MRLPLRSVRRSGAGGACRRGPWANGHSEGGACCRILRVVSRLRPVPRREARRRAGGRPEFPLHRAGRRLVPACQADSQRPVPGASTAPTASSTSTSRCRWCCRWRSADLRPLARRSGRGPSSPARSSSSAPTSCCSGRRSGSTGTGLAGVFYVWVNCFGDHRAGPGLDVRQHGVRHPAGPAPVRPDWHRRVARRDRRRPARPRAGAAHRHRQPAAGPRRPDRRVGASWSTSGRLRSRGLDAVGAPPRRSEASASSAGRATCALAVMVFLVAIVTQWIAFQFSLMRPTSASPANPIG